MIIGGGAFCFCFSFFLLFFFLYSVSSVYIFTSLAPPRRRSSGSGSPAPECICIRGRASAWIQIQSSTLAAGKKCSAKRLLQQKREYKTSFQIFVFHEWHCYWLLKKNAKGSYHWLRSLSRIRSVAFHQKYVSVKISKLSGINFNKAFLFCFSLL